MHFVYKKKVDKNGKLLIDWERRFIRYIYKFKKKNLIVDFKYTDEGSLKSYLSYTMLIASLINKNEKKIKKVHDCFGIIPEIWFNSFTGDKQRYIESYFKKLPPGVVFDYRNHTLTTPFAHKYLYEMVKKASEVVPKEVVRGHLVMAVLSKYGEKFENKILFIFLDNRIVAVNDKGDTRYFSYEALTNSALDTVDFGYICLDKGFCIGDLRDEEFVPKEYIKEYKAQRNLAKVVWKLANYGFPVFYNSSSSQ
jgi:hypothetical protein